MRRQIHLRYFILFFFLPQTLFGQSRQDSPLDSLLGAVKNVHDDSGFVRIRNLISYEYRRKQPDEGVRWAREALAAAQKMKWRKGEMTSIHNVGLCYINKGAYPEALDAFFKAIHIAEELKNQERIGILTGDIGLVYTRQRKFEKALGYMNSSLSIAEKLHNKKNIIVALGNMALVYQLTDRYKEAIDVYLRTLTIAEEIGEVANATTALGNIGSTYARAGDYANALVYQLKALESAEASGNKHGIALNLGNVGTTYSVIGKDTLAPMPDSLVSINRSANLEKAADYLQRSIALSREIQFYECIPGFSDELASVYERQHKYKDAFEVYRSGILLKDSLYSIQNSKIIEDLETNRTLQLKDKDIQIARLEVERKRNERVFFIAGIAALLVIIGIIVYNFRRHERSRRRIKRLQDHKISILDEAVRRRTEQLGSMRQTIATDFHDQTGNMLAAITRQAATLELKLLHQAEVLPLVRSIIHNSNELYASSKDFLWNLNHDSDDPMVLFQYLSSYGQRYYNQFDISFTSLIHGDTKIPLQLQPFAGLNLIYIFKEAMSNVIKHSGADEVSIELTIEAERVTYSLQDNGTWKEADISVEHYGLNNMERRSRQFGFNYNLTQQVTGTRIDVTLTVSTDFSHTNTSDI